MKYAAIYVRVSTLEQKQHGLSVDNQIDSLIKYCEDHQLPYKIYNDAGISAHASYKKRPALLQLISDCQRDQISIILFTRLDRWFRSVKDYYLVMDQLHGVPWRAIWEDYETETSSGQLKVNIMLSVAEAEASRTSEKVKSVLDYKRESGAFVGSAPYGYKIAKIDGKTTLIKDEKTRAAVELFFRSFLMNFSTAYAVRKSQEAGYPISMNKAIKMLRNETYSGRSHECRFEPYITEEEWKEICTQRQIRNRTPKTSGRVYLFVGLLTCAECGRKLRTYNHKAYSGKILYRCEHSMAVDKYTNKRPNTMLYEEMLEAYVLDHLDPEIEKAQSEFEATVKMIDEGKEKKITALRNRTERLKDLYIDGEITKEEYNIRKAAFDDQIKALDVNPGNPPPELPKNWRDIYNSLSKEGRKTFFRKIIERIEVNAGNVRDMARFKIYLRRL